MYKHDHIAIAVSSLKCSEEFYCAIGGRVVSKPSERFTEVMIGEVRLHLILSEAQNQQVARFPRIDHLCLNVVSFSQLQELRDILNKTTASQAFGPWQIQESPPLGPNESHCEERPPLATLYFKDPDGIGLEARCYVR